VFSRIFPETARWHEPNWFDFDVFGCSGLFWSERVNLYLMMYWWNTINGWMARWIELIGIKLVWINFRVWNLGIGNLGMIDAHI